MSDPVVVELMKQVMELQVQMKDFELKHEAALKELALKDIAVRKMLSEIPVKISQALKSERVLDQQALKKTMAQENRDQKINRLMNKHMPNG